MDDASDFDRRVLLALAEGFRARAGTKERFRSLSEYEIARRLGIDKYTYVSYDQSLERESVAGALARLQRRGLAQLASASGRYSTFSPTPAGETAASPEPELAASASPRPDQRSLADQLDEIIRLLRRIDQRLAARADASDPPTLRQG